MNSLVRKRLYEILAISAVCSVLITAITAGLLFVDIRETDEFSGQLTKMAEKALGVKGAALKQKEIFVRDFGEIHRAFQYRNKAGKLIGAGFSLRLSINNAPIGIFVITDDKGRICSSAAWPGVSGTRAENLSIYLSQREKGLNGGLDPTANIKTLDFAVTTAQEKASRIARTLEGSDK